MMVKQPSSNDAVREKPRLWLRILLAIMVICMGYLCTLPTPLLHVLNAIYDESGMSENIEITSELVGGEGEFAEFRVWSYYGLDGTARDISVNFILSNTGSTDLEILTIEATVSSLLRIATYTSQLDLVRTYHPTEVAQGSVLLAGESRAFRILIPLPEFASKFPPSVWNRLKLSVTAMSAGQEGLSLYGRWHDFEITHAGYGNARALGRAGPDPFFLEGWVTNLVDDAEMIRSWYDEAGLEAPAVRVVVRYYDEEGRFLGSDEDDLVLLFNGKFTVDTWADELWVQAIVSYEVELAEIVPDRRLDP